MLDLRVKTKEDDISFNDLVVHRTEVLKLAAEGPGLILSENVVLQSYKFFYCQYQDQLVEAMAAIRHCVLAHMPMVELKAAFCALNLTNPDPNTTLDERLDAFLAADPRLTFTTEEARELAYDGMRTISMFYDFAQQAVDAMDRLELAEWPMP